MEAKRNADNTNMKGKSCSGVSPGNTENKNVTIKIEWRHIEEENYHKTTTAGDSKVYIKIETVSEGQASGGGTHHTLDIRECK